MSDEVYSKLSQVLKEVKPSLKIFNKNSNLQEDLDFDSLDTINFFFEVEKAFDIKVSESEISEHGLLNLAKVIDFVEQRTGN